MAGSIFTFSPSQQVKCMANSSTLILQKYVVHTHLVFHAHLVLHPHPHPQTHGFHFQTIHAHTHILCTFHPLCPHTCCTLLSTCPPTHSHAVYPSTNIPMHTLCTILHLSTHTLTCCVPFSTCSPTHSHAVYRSPPVHPHTHTVYNSPAIHPHTHTLCLAC
jgi:hypothetical protein